MHQEESSSDFGRQEPEAESRLTPGPLRSSGLASDFLLPTIRVFCFVYLTSVTYGKIKYPDLFPLPSDFSSRITHTLPG